MIDYEGSDDIWREKNREKNKRLGRFAQNIAQHPYFLGSIDDVRGGMTGRMSLSFHSPIMEEYEKIVITGNLEQRKEAFKEDEELMKETTKFVTEVIEVATSEATKRKIIESEGGETSEGSRLKGGDHVGRWNNRARGFCNRIINALCPCFTTNELFAWAPYRYRFTRP